MVMVVQKYIACQDARIDNLFNEIKMVLKGDTMNFINAPTEIISTYLPAMVQFSPNAILKISSPKKIF